MEPEKPFACSLPDCGMTFTNEDHLHVHTKKHDMVLQLGMEQKAAFVADQTPTPTRFIRNCEEVGLFQDLQNVNPFDEGFKRAMETKHGILSLEAGSSTEDALHTPHLVFPLEPGDCASYTANNQRNITISRSSSDESGAVKEYETTTISKLTNEVTRISRIVVKHELHEHELARNSGTNERSVSYTNNVIIHSNVEIRKDLVNTEPKLQTQQTDSIKDTVNCLKDVSLKDKLPPIMSQKSLDYVVDSLTSDLCDNDVTKLKRDSKLDEKQIFDDCEVIIKLPNGKHVKMKAVEDDKTINSNTKEKLKKIIKNKTVKATPKAVPIALVQNVTPITAGTLIPVTLLNTQLPVMSNPVQKIPIVPLTSNVKTNFKSVKRKSTESNKSPNEHKDGSRSINCDRSDDQMKRNSREHLDSRSAASRRYRERLKITMSRQSEENKQLREINDRLNAEKALLQLIITQHLKKCPIADDLRNIQEKLQNTNGSLNVDDL
ncbi:unnamed protein product [Euphydryas editha]|uniref:C2H2-type domain-containing protein n=1 Tax=Euphydryas editha TaxID=104508 RepID=A0AAU9TCJ2_EUPED|nr:unnamed protein product [Euphydryas editha]